MIFDSFQQLVKSVANPVILLEGTRAIEGETGARLTDFAARLSKHFPRATFRSGNADGADSYFARGVASVDASRLELVVPQSGHHRANRPQGATIFSLSDLTNDEKLVAQTLTASPGYSFLAENRKMPKFGVKFAYLLRDTLKVAGNAELKLAPATIGMFFVNEAKPKSGGTAHTIRVCEAAGVGVVEQSEWLEWVF